VVWLLSVWGCRPAPPRGQDGALPLPSPTGSTERPARTPEVANKAPSLEPGLGWWVIQRASSQAEQEAWFFVPAGQIPQPELPLPLPACPPGQVSWTSPLSNAPSPIQVTWVAPARFLVLCVPADQHGWCPAERPCAWLWDQGENRLTAAPFYARSLYSQAWPGPEASLTFPCFWQEHWGVCETRFGSQEVRSLYALGEEDLVARHPLRPLLAVRVPEERGCENAASARPGFHLRFIDLESGRTWTWQGFEALFGRPPRCLPRHAGPMQGWFRWAFLGWNPRDPEEFALMVWQYSDHAPADQPLEQVPARGWLVFSDARQAALAAEPLPEGLECLMWAPDGEGFLCQESQHPGVYLWVNRQGQARQRWRLPEGFQIRQWVPPGPQTR